MDINDQNKLLQIVIFGASGDLSKRKLFPALFNLYLRKMLPQNISIIGASRREWSHAEFQQNVRDFLAEFAGTSLHENETVFADFAAQLKFSTLEFNKIDHYQSLKQVLSEDANSRGFAPGEKVELILYYSVEPSFFAEITQNILNSDLLGEQRENVKLVIEKPFGSDFASAQNLQETLKMTFREEQIYRIDHVLSKDALADILKFKQNNYLFTQLLTQEHVKNIQINYSEAIGINGRGNFYEQTGTLRDMVQSHILEALALVMADQPATNGDLESMDARQMQAARAEILESLTWQDGALVLGQYDSYKQEEGVSPTSDVETFVALQLKSSHLRWSGIPIYIKTGKSLNKSYFDIHITFKKQHDWQQQNILTFRISPNSGINLRLWQSGMGEVSSEFSHFDLEYCYRHSQIQEPYENLFREVIRGRELFFISIAEIMHSWQLIDKIRENYANVQIYGYASGSKGPDAADAIVAKNTDVWLDETISDFCKI